MLQALGLPAIKKIDDILTRNNLDIATAINRIEEIHNNLNAGVRKLNAIQDGLGDYVSGELDEIDHHSGILTRISFVENASIQNIVDLKKAANDWHIIGRGLAEICSVRPQDIKIIGASRGSIIFDLLLAAKIVIALDLIISSILKKTKTYYQIKKMAIQIEGMELDNERKAIHLKNLKKDEEEQNTKMIAETVKEVIKTLKLESNKRSNLEKAVKLIANFYEDGGDVDVVLPTQEEVSEEEVTEDRDVNEAIERLRKRVPQTRLLFEEVKRIRHKPSENDNQEDDESEDGQEQD